MHFYGIQQWNVNDFIVNLAMPIYYWNQKNASAHFSNWSSSKNCQQTGKTATNRQTNCPNRLYQQAYLAILPRFGRNILRAKLTSIVSLLRCVAYIFNSDESSYKSIQIVPLTKNSTFEINTNRARFRPFF